MPYFINDGHRIFYRTQGSGPLLFILPGNTATSACHTGELAYFGKRYQAVAIDFWGTGQSDHLAEWSLDWWERAAQDVAALARYLKRPEVILMGTSGGAAIALLAAILFPEQVKAVIADSVVEHLPPDFLRMQVKERAKRTQEQVAFWQIAQGENWQEVTDADSRLLLMMADQETEWFQGRLGEIRCPVLLTASLKDDGLPRPDGKGVGQQVCQIAEQIPISQVHLFNAGGHPLMWSQADNFRRQSDLFLENLVG